jgi:hypothetical protein
VRAGFTPDEPTTPTQHIIGVNIETVSGGSMQVVGFADNTIISQIANDPALLRSQVETLTEKILEEVKTTLTGEDWIKYAQTAESLKKQLLAEQLDASLLKRFASTLAFLGDLEGTIGLMARVWPLLYPLLLIAAAKLG